MMQTIVPGSTVEPTSTNGACARRRSAVERAEHRRVDRDAVARLLQHRLDLGGSSPASHDVERQLAGLDAELVEVGLVDDPQDLADVVVAERHYESFFPAPKALITSAIADVAVVEAGLCTAVTGRDWTTKSPPSRATTHSTS